MKVYSLHFFGGFLCLLIITCGCQKKEMVNQKSAEIIPVKVMTVSPKDIAVCLEYAGNIRARDEVLVFPKVGGKVIEKVKEENSLVTKYEAIAYIDRDEPGLKFEKAPVESPIDGVVGRVFVDIGSNVTTQTSIALVVFMDTVEITLDIPERYLPKISIGMPVTISVDAYPQEEFKGQVSKMSPVLDLSTRAAPIEISIENPDARLKSGMFARTRLNIEEHKQALAIFKEAIIGKDDTVGVYVIEDEKAVFKKVKLGIRQGPYYEITEGINEGDAVVIMGQQRLRDGVAVKAEYNDLVW